MTQHYYKKELVHFNKKLCLQNQNMIIFIDDASCQIEKEEKLSNIKVCYVVMKTTSKLQQFDQR